MRVSASLSFFRSVGATSQIHRTNLSVLMGFIDISELRRLTDAPVVIYTMHCELWNVGRIFQSGSDGVVLKGDSIDEPISPCSWPSHRYRLIQILLRPRQWISDFR